jgi:hypothetical protein
MGDFIVPNEISSNTINQATIKSAKFETAYHESANVMTTFDLLTNPTSMTLSYSSSTKPATSFDGVKYNPVNVTYYHGTIHRFHEVGDYTSKIDNQKGEIVIRHTSVENSGHKILLVHIPTIATDDTSIYGVSKAAEIFQGRKDGEIGPPFTADDILPRKPFLYYVNGNTTSIVIIPSNNTCYVEIPSKYLTELKFPTTTKPITHSTLDSIAIHYSSELPSYGTNLLKDEIYIDCNPAGSSDYTEFAEKGSVAEDLVNGGGSAVKTSAAYGWMIVLSMLIPLIFIVCFWFIFTYITEYLRAAGKKSPSS